MQPPRFMGEDEDERCRGGRRTLARFKSAVLCGVLCFHLGCPGAGAVSQVLTAAPALQSPVEIAQTANGSAEGPPAGKGDGEGTITGTAADADGALIPGARVTLTSGAVSGNRTTVTDSAGSFRFDDVPPGKFKLVISAHDLAPGSASGTLGPGEIYTAIPIVLAIATANESVQVSIPRQEVAEEQVKEEEKQRVIGIIPNYFVTYSRDPAPLSSKQKFDLGWHVILDPTNFLFSGVTAGIEQASDTFPGYGRGAQGFGKRYGAALADGSISTLLRGAVFPSLLRQDPRYYYRGTGSKSSRVSYALETAVICKGDNGRWQPNYSSFLGNLSSGAISNLYYPASSRNGAALTFENALLGIAGVGVGHLLQEFLFRRFTHNAPAATGQP